MGLTDFEAITIFVAVQAFHVWHSKKDAPSDRKLNMVLVM